MQTVQRSVTTRSHPLDPLSAEEIETAASTLRSERELDGGVRFVYISLKEPAKEVVLAFRPGDTVERQASVLLRDKTRRTTYEAVVSVTRRAVTSWREVPGMQPPIMFEEFVAAEQAVKSDPRWQEAMRRRGVEDFESAMIDPWPLGYNGPEDDPQAGRFIRPLTWVRRGGPDDNGYARPVEGLIVRFDLDRMVVADVEDHGPVPLPPRSGNYTAEGISSPENQPHFPAGPRQDLKPVEITQPEGTSFEVDGQEVRWQKWRFRVGFTPREGLVLHTVSYQDGDRLRPVLYRASLSEMFIPYGDPRPTHYRKNVFDMGECGVGALANSLELGCDCLGEIHYFDAVLNDNDGKPAVLRNAVCLHEEDAGLLWKHTDFRTGKAEVRRSRRLVVSMITTIGNYEYGLFWYFTQDGAIQYEVKLTGVISTGALPLGERPRHGTLVAPGLYGPHHQHFFCVRLDMMVDGLRNSVYECDSEALPAGPDNPHGNAWIVKSTLLRSESEAQRVTEPRAARYWKIASAENRNALGEPVAFRLQPGDNVLPFHQSGSQALRRAEFTTRHLWVTAYDADQNFPAGDYPNQHPGGDGLPAYAAGDRPLEDADVVVWYTFGAHHVVRAEDWPVMPVTHAGFQLKPEGFFDGNPALDVPAAQHCPS
ncbi:primary-amine oxidase [Candidatus Nephthysia bennettiae]|uniref:Amine oxidase n=1 Tax=Candidatus Nephthysia bennettiae TaxID=3127016 RepID=A0A934N805_9BACT|nr:primary-amine oxidase [Candidatus Dormibacteraeota bacterium]MBJ7612709.1 primary-amine oxidase [Candidatus Dormibacteraeota bacterium]